jgi:hypothetical protein
MGIPNMQQRFYLAKALNEDTDHLFDHPETLVEQVEGNRRPLKRVLPKTPKAEKAKPVTKTKVHRTGGDWKTPADLKEGSRGLARHERIVKALTRKAASLKATPDKMSSAYNARAMNKLRLSKGQQDRDRTQIARERGRAGLDPRITARSVNATHADETGTWRVKSEPRSLSKGFAAARVPKAVLKYRETSKAKKAAALAAKGKQ